MEAWAKGGIGAVGEHPPLPKARHAFVEMGQGRQAAAEHDHLRVQHVDDVREAAREEIGRASCRERV